jgi:hypothetical protein
MLVKSFILFRISLFPLKTIIENGKRETGNEKVTDTNDTPFYGAGQSHVLQAWLVTSAAGIIVIKGENGGTNG